MTREEAKELLPIIKAFAEGKTIQIKSKDKWLDLYESDFRCSPDKYRIKPGPKYRPFKNQEECWQEMQEHQPFGWLKHIYIGDFEYIRMVCKETIQLVETNSYLYENAFKYYKFPDGTPFGIKED